MIDLVKVTDVKNHQQGTIFESKDSDKKIHPPKSQKKQKALFDKEIYEKYLYLDVIKIGDVEFKLKYSKGYKRMSYDEFEPFFYDIAAHGILDPVALDENSNVIYGWNRIIAAHILNLKKVPFVIYPKLTDERKNDMAYVENVLRRQMTKEEIDELVIKLKKEGKSSRQIASELGIGRSSVLRKLGSGGPNGPPELPLTTIGKDGKCYPSIVKSKNPSIFVKSVAEAGKITKGCSENVVWNLPDTLIDKKKFSKIVSAVKTQELRKQNYTDYNEGSCQLLLGDFREKAQEVEDESINVIFTDPPYDQESLHLWDDLGILAKRVLKPGGMLLSYSGNLYLPQIYKMLGDHLEYVWTLGNLHTGHTMIVHPVNVQQQWKPIVWYCKPPFSKYWSAFRDMYSGGQEKTHHEWQQAVGEAQYYLKALCPKDAVVLDPMCGAATTVIAAKQLGFKAIGIEADAARYAVAQQRLIEIG